MKAIVYTQYGLSDVLQLSEIEKPTPKDNEVLIKVRAAALNAGDSYAMRGTPYIARNSTGLRKPKNTRLGVDMAGEIEAVGKDVTEFKPGDEVYSVRTGAFGEYVCKVEKTLALKPTNLTFEQAAAVPVAGCTALQGLRDKGQIKAGHKVLINGAGGGVGTFAVQIAKAFDTHVTAVCHTHNVEMVRSIGADEVIDYTKADFTKSGQRYDLVFDVAGNRPLSVRNRLLTPAGMWVVAGAPRGGRVLGPASRLGKVLLLKRFGSKNLTTFIASVTKEDLIVLKDLIEAGKLTPVIDRRYPLSEVPAAMRYMEEGHARGKIIITIP